MNEMKFEDFLVEKEDLKGNGSRTVNIRDSIHQFYKKVANHYDVGISTVITNVLIAWKEEHKAEIKSKMINSIRKIDL